MPQFAALPDRGEGLVDLGSDLEAVLEGGALEGACDRYHAGASDRRTKLLCGKWMFFYESFGTAGVPGPLVDLELTHMADLVGAGFSEYGLIADPFSEKKYPLGLAPTDAFGSLPALAFSCASCHFGQLPDGRYSVGFPNHRYDYGSHVLALSLPTLVALGGPEGHHPAALAKVQPLTDRIVNDPVVSAAASAAVGELTTALQGSGADLSAFLIPAEDEAHYASWLPGTMDFLIAPLPVRDGVHTISKIPPLWEIPEADEEASAGMRHAMLGWTGGTRSLMNFLLGFVSFGGGPPEAWPESRLAPLAEYIHSLRRPDLSAQPAPSVVTRGAALFESAGCGACHSGPRGSGLDVYAFDAIGTDDAMKRWFDEDLDGVGCCGVEPTAGDEITHAIKSPRLLGLWAMDRFLHNGSVPSLEALFCIDATRPTIEEPAYGDAGHEMTCTPELDREEREALIAFLRTL